MPNHRTRPRRARLRHLRLLYVAETVSGLGDGVFWVGLIAAISGADRFDALLALAVVVRLAPRALLSLPAGSLVDRSDVRRLLLGCDLARAIVMLVLALALERGLDVRWALPAVLLAYLFGVPSRPAVSASLPSIAGETDLATANATISTIRQLMTFLGPLAGVAVAAWSVPGAFACNGVTLVLSASCIAAIRGVRWPTASRPRRRLATLATAPAGAWLEQVDGLVTLVGLTTVMYAVRGAEIVLHVLVVRDLVRADPTTVGYLGGAVGLGAMAVAPVARRIAARDRALVPLLAAIALTAAPTAALALSGTVAVASLLLVPVGAGMILFEVVTVVTIQRTAPAAVLGRAFGALNTASHGGKLLGAIVTPPIAVALGTGRTLVLVAAVTVLGGAVAAAPLRRLSERAEQRRAALAPIASTLAELGLFHGTPQSGLERIAQHVRAQQLEPGAVLIREGDAPDDVFVIRRGKFDVSIDGKQINGIAAGDWAGEIGLVEDLPRTATVTAASPATVWRVPGALFLAVLASADDTDVLDGVIARRLAVGRSAARG